MEKQVTKWMRGQYYLLTGATNPSFRHGMTKSPEYRIWVDMRQRCTNENRHNFKHYGGRGIAVCERWQLFENFFEDVKSRPSSKHSIERVDVNGNYEPGNVKWATVTEQRNNMRSNRWIEIDGRRQTIGGWAKERGLDERLIRIRIRRGISERDAVMTPKQPNIGGRRIMHPQFNI